MNSTHNLYKAIAKSMLSRYAVYALSIITMMIMARLFTPQTFGTFAAISVFYIFFQLMTEAGLGPAIINIDELDETDRNGIFGLTVIVGTIFAVIFYSAAPLIMSFYQVPRVDEVVPFVSIALFFFASSIVPSAFLLRDQAFVKIAHAGLVSEVISTTGSVILLNYLDPLHALASKVVFSSSINFTLLLYFSANTEFGRPKWGCKFYAIRPLLRFSLYQFAFNFINYFSRNLDNILVGKYLGAISLGIYDKAYQLMRYPLMLLTAAMTPAIQPVIRKCAGDIDLVESIHRDFAFKISLLGSIAGLAVFFLSDFIVLLLLGSQWIDVIPIIKVLAIAIPVQVVLSTSGSFFQAMNRTDLLFFSGAISAIVMILAIVWGVFKRDMIVLSWGLVIAFHINFVQAYYIMYSYIFKKRMARFFLRMVPFVLTVISMLGWSYYAER